MWPTLYEISHEQFINSLSLVESCLKYYVSQESNELLVKRMNKTLKRWANSYQSHDCELVTPGHFKIISQLLLAFLYLVIVIYLGIQYILFYQRINSLAILLKSIFKSFLIAF